MKKSSFISIFKEEFEIEESDEKIKLSKIVIPMIQRDYAQGRTNEESVKRVRDRFLQALLNAIEKNSITLDFVYGDIDKNGILIPLDGQQRLTTLFLLHWYASRKENISDEESEFLNNFTYETRYEANSFCKKLSEYRLKEDCMLISEEIINQPWFLYSWKKDPTVKSMLVMLDAIQDKFKNTNNIFESLKNGAITFYFRPIKDMGLTDEIYIKMNSRGKPLTEFENFKAEFEQELKTAYENNKINEVLYKNIIHKIDCDWTDMLWKYSRYDNYLIDNLFLNYFRFVCDIISYKETEEPIICNELDLIKRLFSVDNNNISQNLELLERYFDYWANIDNINGFFERYLSLAHEKNKVKIFSGRKIDLFKECITNYKKMDRISFFLLYSFIIYFENSEKIEEKDFVRRLRIINNLLNNSPNELAIRQQRKNRTADMFRQIEKIMIEEEFITDKLDFSKIQLKEEIEKLKWTKNNTYENIELLFQLEDSDVLYGQVAIIGLDNIYLTSKFLDLFENNNYQTINHALLAIGNYAQRHNKIYQLGSTSIESWRNLFHISDANEYFENTKAVLITLLNLINTNTSLQYIINSFLEECEKNNNYLWRYYFIKYRSFNLEKIGKYEWPDFEKSPYILYVMNTLSRPSENAYQPFLKEIDKNNNLVGWYRKNEIRDEKTSITLKNNAYIIENMETGELQILEIEQSCGIDKEDRIKKIFNLIEN